MITIAVLAVEGSPLSSIALPVDILNAAGVFYNRLAGLPVKPLYSVSIVSAEGKPVQCYNSLTLDALDALKDIPHPDVVIIGALATLAGFQEKHRETIRLLRTLHNQGSMLASICSGAFLLASTGLLDGKNATTHWGMSGEFEKLFPKVCLDTSKTVIDEGRLLSSGGAYAGADLALYLVRKFHGNEVADKCARVLLIDPYRASQAPYEIMDIPIDHGDTEVSLVQEWIGDNYSNDFTIEELAGRCALSRRTFERRFKKATGKSPLGYIQYIRVEKAKYLLERGSHSFETITNQVGYEDVSSFRRLFQKSTGLPPSVYRQKFQSNHDLKIHPYSRLD